MAASKLVQKLDRDFLECGICLDRFRKPRGLPCLHSFCHECLVRYCQGRKQVLCPNCKKPTTIPKEGVSGFPAHFMVNSLQETLDMEKLKVQGETEEDTPCDNCKLPGKNAKVRCLNCNMFFCETCHASHNMLQLMKQHKVVNMEDLRSGTIMLPVTSTQDQKCEEHDGETKRFYCETCRKPVCRDCIVMKQKCRDHDYISLKDASKKQTTRLMELKKQGDDCKKKCQEAINKTESVTKNLANAAKEANKNLEEEERKYKEQVSIAYNKCKADVCTAEKERAIKLDQTKEELQTQLTKFENACDAAAKVTQIGSDYDITSLYPSLSGNLEELSKMTQPVAADENLGYFTVQDVTKLEIPNVVCMFRGERWKETGQFSTRPELHYPYGITVHPDEDVAVTSRHGQCATVFSKDGSVKHTFKGSFDASLLDIAITPDNRYILPGTAEILFHDSQGNQLKSTNAATYDVNNKPSNPKTLAVDSRGRIIAGLYGHTISIHHADGHLISKFATPGTPRMLAVTSKGDIVCTFEDHTLKVMDYSGNNVRVVQRPQGVNGWNPWGICCSQQGEIFVVNHGKPKAVYRYTADGDQCLGCVITGLDNPFGIAITEDGQQMFVTEFRQDLVKIFQRQ